MNNVINKFLLAGDYYSACGPFTKHKQRIQKFKETGDANFIYKNELDKACFSHDTTYSDGKYLTKRTVADKILRNKAFNIAKDPKYDGYQRRLDSMVYKFFDKKSASLSDKSTEGSGVNNKIILQIRQKNFINSLLKKLRKERYTQHLKIIFGMLI